MASQKCEPGCTCRRHIGYGGGNPGRPRREPLQSDDRKTCTACGETKPVAQFSLSRRATETRNAVYRPWCKPCQSERALKWFNDNHERALDNKRSWEWLRRYGITPEQYDAMLAEQGGVCAICGNEETSVRGPFKTRFRLSVDHDHATGKVRGLLCQKCNRSIGLMNDDVDLLKKAIYYLQERA
jgi:hypothetical protein